jgi:transposase-like protein
LYGIIWTRFIHHHALLRKSRPLCNTPHPNKALDQDHRNIKSRTNVMLGFERFRNTAITLAGIALMYRIRKGQFNLAKLDRKDATVPTVWNTVLSYP